MKLIRLDFNRHVAYDEDQYKELATFEPIKPGDLIITFDGSQRVATHEDNDDIPGNQRVVLRCVRRPLIKPLSPRVKVLLLIIERLALAFSLVVLGYVFVVLLFSIAK